MTPKISDTAHKPSKHAITTTGIEPQLLRLAPMRSRLPLAVLAQLLVAARGCVVVSDSHTDRDDATCAAGGADDGENPARPRGRGGVRAVRGGHVRDPVGTAGIHMILTEVNMTAQAAPTRARSRGASSPTATVTRPLLVSAPRGGSARMSARVLAFDRARDAWSFSAPDGDGGSLRVTKRDTAPRSTGDFARGYASGGGGAIAVDGRRTSARRLHAALEHGDIGRRRRAARGRRARAQSSTRRSATTRPARTAARSVSASTARAAGTAGRRSRRTSSM